MPNTWIIEQSDTTVLVTRRKPVRWDVEARATFPRCYPLRLAHQIRQDLWRELRKLKGFAPAVEVTLSDPFEVRAGGRVARHIPPRTNARIEALLLNPRHRARWLAWARVAT